MIQVQNCTLGQVQQNAAICSTCPAATFSLNPLNASCDACPAGATCFGGSNFIPPSQSWHSHPYSTNIVQCPNAKACQGNRTLLLSCKEVNSLQLVNLGAPFQSFTVTVASFAHWHSNAHMSCIQCMAKAGSQQLQSWVIICLAIIKIKCFPAHDELGIHRTSLVSPESNVVHAAFACQNCN